MNSNRAMRCSCCTSDLSCHRRPSSTLHRSSTAFLLPGKGHPPHAEVRRRLRSRRRRRGCCCGDVVASRVVVRDHAVSECPVEIAMSRSAWPASRAIVTKVWRSEWGVMRLVTPAALATRPTIRRRRDGRAVPRCASGGPGRWFALRWPHRRPRRAVDMEMVWTLAALAKELRGPLTAVVTRSSISSAQVSETRSPLSPRRQITAWSRAGLDSTIRRTSANSVRVTPGRGDPLTRAGAR